LLHQLFEATQRLDVNIEDVGVGRHLAQIARQALEAETVLVLRRTDGVLEVVARSSEDGNDNPVVEANLPTEVLGDTRMLQFTIGESSQGLIIAVELPKRVNRRLIESALPLLVDRLDRFLSDHAEIAEKVNTDSLTGIGNRHAAQAALDRLTVGQAVVIFDIDNFKAINDLFGHAAGDAVLKQVAAFLTEHLRPTDVISRPGGDEFLVTLSHASDPAAIVERLLSSWHDREPLVTLSAGLAIAGPTEDARQTLARADGALYKAKAEGRAQLHLAAKPTAH
jgi:diguanylate cyclase (GGDEF)-like protein